MRRGSLVVCLLFILSGILFVSCGERRGDRTKDTSTRNETAEGSEQADTDKGDTTGDTSATQEEAREETRTLSFKKEEDMKAIVAEIRRKFDNKPVKMMDIHFYDDGRVILDAQDPENKKNVNRYTYRDGSWNTPQPIELKGTGKLEDNLFSLEEANLLAIPNLVKEAMTRGKDIEGAKVEHVYAETTTERRRPEDKVAVYVTVEGPRGSKTLIADGKGKVKSFK